MILKIIYEHERNACATQSELVPKSIKSMHEEVKRENEAQSVIHGPPRHAERRLLAAQ